MEQELKLLEWIGIGTDLSCSGQLCQTESFPNFSLARETSRNLLFVRDSVRANPVLCSKRFLLKTVFRVDRFTNLIITGLCQILKLVTGGLYRYH